jgi:hypothetical protein
VDDYTKLNYDAKKQYNLSVQASDGELSTTAILIISLNKINQMPQVENATFTIDENSAMGTIVGTITASDSEDDQLTVTFLTGNELSAFGLTGKTLTVTNTEALDFEMHPVFNLTINVSDGISNVQATVTVNLNDVAENTDNAITTFTVPGMVGEPEIDIVAHTIRVYVSGVDLNALAAGFTISNNATADPANGATFNFSSPQTIVVTSQSGDPQEWVVTVTFPTANKKLVNPAIKLYPNPAIDFLIVSGVEAGSQLKIVSLSGQIMFSKTADKLDGSIEIANFQKGVYLLLIENRWNKSIQKFFKE